ncbi:hypothetical protein MD484_g812, partial [Candolleomyces efflorescens]
MAPHPYPAVISIHETFGAGLVGALINAIMYGLTTLQTYLYYLYYPKDSKQTKSLVFLVWFIDTVHTMLVSWCIYHYLVSNYNNEAALKAFLVFAHFVFGVLTVAYCFIKRDFSRLSEFTLFAATPFAATAVLADVLIAGSLCILLHGSRTGFRRTDALVTTLIVYAVNRCLLTATAAVVEVIVFSLRSYALWYLAIDFVIGKLYANSFLASLNSRQALQTRAGPSLHGTGTHTDIQFESRPVSCSFAQRNYVVNCLIRSVR